MTAEEYSMLADIGIGALGLIVALAAVRLAGAVVALRRELRSLRPPKNDSDRPEN